MKAPWTVRSAEAFGRIPLSQNFFMRDFLYSEIASINGMVTRRVTGPRCALLETRSHFQGATWQEFRETNDRVSLGVFLNLVDGQQHVG
jgi:hypothetical protein